MANVYPFDPAGTSSANRIINEQHVITAVNFRDYHYVIPKFAPFFERNLQIRIQFPDGQTRSLIEGVDYYLSNQFIDASKACAKPLFGSISFLDTSLYGIMSISYNTVGGMWNLSASEISRILAEELRNPRTTAWEQITNLPQRFPVVDHEWDLIDMVGASGVVTSIDAVAQAILSANGGGLNSHVGNLENPHSVTKTQVGLGSVQNYGIASQAQAQDGTSNSAYMTPLRTAEAIGTIARAIVTTHENRTDNPHGTTKTQVGLGNVQNFPIATTTEATDGTAPDRYMTPALTSVLIAPFVSSLTTHVIDKQNPHDVTKAQVGLFNVENYVIATEQEARAGLLNDRYMTPLRTMQLCREFVSVELDSHITQTNNPHSVTKDQVGLALVQNYGLATQAEAEAGTSNLKYMTPSRTAQAIAKLALIPLNDHTLRTDNPHEVTKTQVALGNVDNYLTASEVEARAGLLNDRFMTPLRTMQLCREFVSVELDGHATLTNNPHSVTKTQVGLGSVQNYGIASNADMTTGTAADKYVTPALVAYRISQFYASSIEPHVLDKNNPHIVTAAQVGAYSTAQVDQILLDYQKKNEDAANALKLEGRTTLQLRDWLLQNMPGFDADSINGFTAQQLIQQAADRVSDSFLQVNPLDYILTNAVGFTWMRLAEVTRTIDPANPGTVENLDSAFIVSGGELYSSASTSSVDPIVVRTRFRRTGVDTPVVEAQRIFATPASADVTIGYVWTAADSKLSIYAKVPRASRRLAIADISGRPFEAGNEITEVPVEPAGIAYVSAEQRSEVSSNAEKLGGQPPAYYATAAQITTTNQRIGSVETNYSTKAELTALSQSVDATYAKGADLTALAQRVTAIETLLASINVV